MKNTCIFSVLLLSCLISISTVLAFDNNKQTLLIFSASWCGPCNAMKQDLHKDKNLSEAIKQYDIIELDYDIDKDAVAGYNIKMVPSFVITSNGKEIARKVGYNGGANGLYQFLK